MTPPVPAARRPSAALLWVLLAAMGAGPLFNYGVSASSTVVMERLDVTSGQLGTVMTVVFAAAAVTSLGLGRAADRLSARAQLSIIFGGTAAALVLGAVAPSLPVLYAAAAVAGVTQAISNPTTNRIIRTVVPPERRIGWVGVKQSGVQAAQLVGGLFFPAASLALGWTGAALAAAVLIGALWVLALVAAPPLPGAPPSATGPAGGRRRRDTSPLPATVWFFAAIAFLTGLGMQATNTYLPLFAVETLGMTLVAGGAAAAVSGVVGVLSRIGWSRRMSSGDRPTTLLTVICLGAVAGVVVFLAADLLDLPALLWVGAAVHGLTVLGANVVINAGLLSEVPAERLGRATGANSMGMYAGFALGPLLMGVLRDVTGDYRVGFAVVAVGYLLALGVVLLLRRHVGRRGADA
ncbi:MFS transporter [Micrococcus luteus]|uniref:MFS transporter n=1 Tax=Micrococcus luteus TaxID=1270 RepID=UPI0037AD30B6